MSNQELLIRMPLRHWRPMEINREIKEEKYKNKNFNHKHERLKKYTLQDFECWLDRVRCKG